MTFKNKSTLVLAARKLIVYNVIVIKQGKSINIQIQAYSKCNICSGFVICQEINHRVFCSIIYEATKHLIDHDML